MMRDAIAPNASQLIDALDQLTAARALLDLVCMAHRTSLDDDGRAVSAGCEEVASRLCSAIKLIEMVREGDVA